MRRLILLGVVASSMDPYNVDKIQTARNEEISFIESTLRSMQHNQDDVRRSNAALDKQVETSEKALEKIVAEVGQIQKHTQRVIHPPGTPASFLQVKSKFDDDYSEDSSSSFAKDNVLDEDSTSSIFRQPQKPMSVLERARAKAAAAETQFQNAMKRLTSDRDRLLKDEAVHRARAADETRRF